MLKFCSTLALIVATVPTAAVMAQANTAPKTAAAPAKGQGTVIAVIDMMYIMEKHEDMIALKEATNKKSRELNSSLQARSKELVKDQEKLRDLKVGSPEYRALQEKLVQLSTKLDADAKLGDSQIKEELMKAQLDILLEVQDAIKNYALRRGIDLVVNFDGEPANADKLETSVRAFRSIVQFQNDVDITLDILKIVSPPKAATKTTGPASSGGGNGQVAPVRAGGTKKG